VNYYNEFDPKAAAWIQQLIADKQIPNGIVDARSITDTTADTTP
jgi:DNA (cytosine-5)-methyltransferase 1